MRRAAGTLVIAYSAVHFAVTGVRQALANSYGDFLAAIPAWQVAEMFGRTDLYGPLAYIWGPPPLWNYGPLLHVVTLPLFAFPNLRAAYVAWLMVCYVVVAATVVVAIGVLDDWKPTLATTVVVIAVFCNFNPLYDGLSQRVIELFELLLLFAAYAWLRRGRDGAAGAAIGAAAMLKFLPLIFLPWLVLKRRWRALGAALAVIVPVSIATQFTLGWQNSRIVWQLAGGGLIHGDTDQSLAGMLGRLSLGVGALPAIVLSLAALSWLMLRVRRVRGAEDLEWSLLIVAMVLLPPHNENYYLLFFVFPYLFLARRRISPLLIVSFLLVAAPVPLSIFGADAFGHYLAFGIPFIGAALLAGVVAWELGMSCAVSRVEQQCPWKRPSPISPLS